MVKIWNSALEVRETMWWTVQQPQSCRIRQNWFCRRLPEFIVLVDSFFWNMEFQYFFTLFTLGLFKQLFQALASIPVTPENFLKQSWFNLDQSSWTKSETPWEPPPTRWTLNPWQSESLRTLDLLLLKLLKKNWLKDLHQPLLLLLSQRHLVACPAFLEMAKILSKLNLLISTTTMNSMLL